jgi:hypothetical protein
MLGLAGVQRRFGGCTVWWLAAGLLVNACGQGSVPEREDTKQSAAVVRAAAANRASSDRSAGVPRQRSRTGEAADRTQRAEIDTLQRTLASRLRRSAPELTAQRTTAGSMRIDLHGRYRHISVLSRRSDGSFERRCITATQPIPTLVQGAEGAEQ